MLHGDKAHGPCQRAAGGHLEGDLLIDGIFQAVAPLAAEAAEGVRHFGRRRARIAGNHVHAGFQRAADNGLIAKQQMPLAAAPVQQGIFAHGLSLKMMSEMDAPGGGTRHPACREAVFP